MSEKINIVDNPLLEEAILKKVKVSFDYMKYGLDKQLHNRGEKKYIENDGALERRFQKVMVNATTAEETIQILNNIKEKYEEHHKVPQNIVRFLFRSVLWSYLILY